MFVTGESSGNYSTEWGLELQYQQGFNLNHIHVEPETCKSTGKESEKNVIRINCGPIDPNQTFLLIITNIKNENEDKTVSYEEIKITTFSEQETAQPGAWSVAGSDGP